ncbi:hypothetical protein BDA96_03G307800 [Sorghum bicolor]|uniref:rRNA N-glycosylase n=1 Tax=Sorghum bicolor TaxID=4558 RepID=A0A921UP33_SORBI|nr:hypothetical protein BDA96_03G307800 [Sorghum bicolor]
MVMMMMRGPILLLLLVGVGVCVFADAKTTTTEVWQDDKATVTMTLDVTLGVQHFKATMSQLERQAALTTTKPHIEKRPVLGKQKARPDNWAHVTVKGNGGIQSTLAIRLDNMYLVGFKTGANWYAFDGKENLIQGSTKLGFGDTYKSLTGGSYLDLTRVEVGKKPAEDALATLASYHHGSTPQKEVKKALVTFVLMLCEGSRLTLVRQDVIAAWDKGGKVGTTAVKLTTNWRIVSCALLHWSKSKKWNSAESKEIEKLGDPEMKTPAAAAANIYLILQAEECSPDATPTEKEPQVY